MKKVKRKIWNAYWREAVQNDRTATAGIPHLAALPALPVHAAGGNLTATGCPWPCPLWPLGTTGIPANNRRQCCPLRVHRTVHWCSGAEIPHQRNCIRPMGWFPTVWGNVPKGQKGRTVKRCRWYRTLKGWDLLWFHSDRVFGTCRPPARSFISCYWRETSSTAATRFFGGWLETSSPEATLPRISSPTRQNQRKKLMGSLPRLWHSTVPFATRKSRPASMMNENCLCYQHKYTNKTLCRLAACYLRRLEVI